MKFCLFLSKRRSNHLSTIWFWKENMSYSIRCIYQTSFASVWLPLIYSFHLLPHSIVPVFMNQTFGFVHNQPLPILFLLFRFSHHRNSQTYGSQKIVHAISRNLRATPKTSEWRHETSCILRSHSTKSSRHGELVLGLVHTCSIPLHGPIVSNYTPTKYMIYPHERMRHLDVTVLSSFK
jgi:hypothetical protein